MAENTDTVQPAGEEINGRKGENQYEAWFQNGKLTYDKFLQMITASGEKSADFDVQVKNVAVQALQNAVENANILSKNTLVNVDLGNKHALNNFALSINKQWNLDVPEAASQVEVLKATGANSATIAALQVMIIDAVKAAIAAEKEA